ncbi:hypothetical protein ACIQD3_21915 [Peribacillus loiseleuriae]|uniref:hypothetical protein n=1 Tax=Peribacillus loiseleuriae TaxID=1679170 RepID=UPI0037FA68E9
MWNEQQWELCMCVKIDVQISGEEWLKIVKSLSNDEDADLLNKINSSANFSMEDLLPM